MKRPRWLSRALDESPRGLLGTSSDLVAVLTVIFGAVALVREGPFPQGVLAIAVSALALSFIGISFRLQRRLNVAKSDVARSVQMGDAMPKLAEATSNLARAALAAETSPDGFLRHAEKAVGVLAEMYGIATAHPCRVTLVEIYAPGKSTRLAVRPLCTSYPDTGRRPGAQIDWVDDNTDFQDLIITGNRFFFCNDLPKELGEGYKNSHWPRERIAEMKKKNLWPYRSTIVWPVRGFSAGPEGKWDHKGFLCVDSVAASVFDQDLDVAPGETFAYALYLGLSAYLARQDDANAPPASEETPG